MNVWEERSPEYDCGKALSDSEVTMKVKNLHAIESELVHNGTVTAWTLFRADDLLSDILWFNDNLIQPGVAIEAHEHEDIEEVYYVLQGQGQMRIGKEGKPISEGNAVYLPPRKTHTLRNTGTYPIRFVCIGAKVSR